MNSPKTYNHVESKSFLKFTSEGNLIVSLIKSISKEQIAMNVFICFFINLFLELNFKNIHVSIRNFFEDRHFSPFFFFLKLNWMQHDNLVSKWNFQNWQKNWIRDQWALYILLNKLPLLKIRSCYFKLITVTATLCIRGNVCLQRRETDFYFLFLDFSSSLESNTCLNSPNLTSFVFWI